MNRATSNGVSIIVIMLISFFGASFIASAHASNIENNSSLIGSLESVINSVNYTSDIEATYQGMMVGKTSMQQLINAYNSLTTATGFGGSGEDGLQYATEVLQWTPIMQKLGYENQTTIEWALNSQVMMSDGLPYCYNDGATEAFLVYDRYLILAYGYAIQYNYELNKWNLTEAYNSFKAGVTESAAPALLWLDSTGAPFTISYGP